MTGIERLRELAELRVVENRESVTLRSELRSIADQIEREQGEHAGPYDYRRIRIEWAIRGVLREMERHISGVEGMEDSPVARWARELREALGGDALTDEDREASAWVREHGGLDYVRAEWRSRVPYDRYEARRQRLLGHIAECETALGRRRRSIEKLGKTIEFFQLNNSNFRHLLADVAERLGFTRYGDDYEPEDLLDALDRRLMPEGMEWPRYEDGGPVRIGDYVQTKEGLGKLRQVLMCREGFYLSTDGCDEWHRFGERVKRPAVPASDGKPLEVGQTVWDTDAESDTPLTVVEVSSDLIRCEYMWKDGKTYRPCYPPSVLTHTKPEIDSWERIEEDADALVDAEINGEGSYNAANAYCNRRGLGEGTSFVLMAQDLVRRCRALAERERGE